MPLTPLIRLGDTDINIVAIETISWTLRDVRIGPAGRELTSTPMRVAAAAVVALRTGDEIVLSGAEAETLNRYLIGMGYTAAPPELRPEYLDQYRAAVREGRKAKAKAAAAPNEMSMDDVAAFATYINRGGKDGIHAWWAHRVDQLRRAHSLDVRIGHDRPAGGGDDVLPYEAYNKDTGG